MYSAKYGGRSGRAKGKQTASKKKKHQKCSICQTQGHSAEDCPRIKNPEKNSGGAGSGISHKGTNRPGGHPNGRSKSDTDDKGDSSENSRLLPAGFFATVEDIMVDIMSSTTTSTTTTVLVPPKPPPPVIFDAGCDVGGALEYVESVVSSNKKKASTTTYRKSMDTQSAIPYAGCICRQMLKPGKAWKADAQRTLWMKEADPHTFFALGLGAGFLSEPQEGSDEEGENDEREAAADALLEAIETDDRVVGFFAKLDYSPERMERPGYERDAQLSRFRATCSAAIEANVPIQCRVAPGPSDDTNDNDNDGSQNNDADPYILVMRDLATILLEMTPPPLAESSDHTSSSSSNNNNNGLRVHLVCWNGNSTHMMKLLTAFPNNLYVGMNAAVGFAKASRAHECAFDLPLNRLLLETDAPNAIPAPITISMGRGAFCHSGLIPFVAAAVAGHKGSLVTALDVANAAAENVAKLYGHGVASRIEEVASELAETIEAFKKEKEQEALDQAAEAITQNELEPASTEVFESKKEKKKKKKKGKAAGPGGVTHEAAGETTELDFDESFLDSMVS
jgi:Tat protein secretion system quality control protein TatD with DNase activity